MNIKLEYTFVHFVEVPNPGSSTFRWDCLNNETNVKIGEVRWNGGWWKYTCKTRGVVEFDYICYEDIAAFLREASSEQRKIWRNKS